MSDSNRTIHSREANDALSERKPAASPAEGNEPPPHEKSCPPDDAQRSPLERLVLRVLSTLGC